MKGLRGPKNAGPVCFFQSGVFQYHAYSPGWRETRFAREAPLTETKNLDAVSPGLRTAQAKQRYYPTAPAPADVLVQLDDLTDEQYERVRPAAFLLLRTSPRGKQAWVCIEGTDKEIARDRGKAQVPTRPPAPRYGLLERVRNLDSER
jgi:hypothetical protein